MVLKGHGFEPCRFSCSKRLRKKSLARASEFLQDCHPSRQPRLKVFLKTTVCRRGDLFFVVPPKKQIPQSVSDDYSVCTTWGVKGKGYYLLHVLRARLEYPELKRQVRMQAAEWEANNILIEDKASGTQLCQELIREGMQHITKCESKGEKVMRMNSVTSAIENGFVYLPERAAWLTGYLHELATFPKGKHDDQADSTSQALKWLRKGTAPYGGVFEYYKREYMKMIKSGQITDFPAYMLKYLEE